jgi:signal transduction histidine kinase
MERSVILNVDDYLPGRYARTKILRQAGFVVLEAGTGEETLRIVEQHNPALILLDVNLPDINGFELCKRIRGIPNLAATTILHVSASSIMPQHQVYGLDSGADGYLVEPLEPSVLIATVNAHLRIRRAEAALRRSNQGLEEFAFVISHDLQEPLRHIGIYTELLAGHLAPHMDDSSRLYEGYIRTGVARMQNLIRDLLQFSRLMREGEEGEGTSDLSIVLDRVLDSMRAVIEAERAHISCDKLPIVRGDDMMLEQVFRNLISNAIKYRKQDTPPESGIAAHRNGRSWTISVKDNGIGFDPKYSERIFVLFQRLHGQEYSGTGVGLAICKRVIEKSGGRIWADSAPGVGSTFHFTINASEEAAA